MDPRPKRNQQALLDGKYNIEFRFCITEIKDIDVPSVVLSKIR